MKSLGSYKTKEWMGFDKDGIGGILIYTKTKSQALKQARNIYGKGASVEFQKNTSVERFKN